MADKTSPWLSLKNHPLIIVLGFCAATAAGTAAVYEKIVMPYNVKILENQISDLNRQLASIPNTEKTIAERDASITKLRAEIITLKQRTLELTKDNVFSVDDPYPKAFRRIRIGDLFSKLEETYPGQVWKEPENSFASIDPDDFFFPRVTYYYDEMSKPYRVTHILFQLKKDITFPPEPPEKLSNAAIKKIIDDASQEYVGVLNTQLTERYGQGKAGNRENTWRVNGLLLTLKDKGLLSIDKP